MNLNENKEDILLKNKERYENNKEMCLAILSGIKKNTRNCIKKSRKNQQKKT
jgi:hypothetical protein